MSTHSPREKPRNVRSRIKNQRGVSRKRGVSVVGLHGRRPPRLQCGRAGRCEQQGRHRVPQKPRVQTAGLHLSTLLAENSSFCLFVFFGPLNIHQRILSLPKLETQSPKHWIPTQGSNHVRNRQPVKRQNKAGCPTAPAGDTLHLSQETPPIPELHYPQNVSICGSLLRAWLWDP